MHVPDLTNSGKTRIHRALRIERAGSKSHEWLACPSQSGANTVEIERARFRVLAYYNGMFPCFLTGRSSCLVFKSSSDRISSGRVRDAAARRK